MLYELINDFPNELINLEKEPFISIYQPTHRQKPESTQDSIRFKNLMQQVEKTLKEDYKEVNIDAIMKPLSQIAEDNIFCERASCLQFIESRRADKDERDLDEL